MYIGTDKEWNSSSLMRPSQYLKYEESGIVQPTEEGFAVHVHSTWPVEGEDRIGYTQIIRLVECAREKHWQSFSVQIAPKDSLFEIDSTVVEITGRFMRPMKTNGVYIFSWRIVEINSRGYVLEVSAADNESKILTARFMIKSRYLRSSDGLPIDVVVPTNSTSSLLASFNSAAVGDGDLKDTVNNPSS